MPPSQVRRGGGHARGAPRRHRCKGRHSILKGGRGSTAAARATVRSGGRHSAARCTRGNPPVPQPVVRFWPHPRLSAQCAVAALVLVLADSSSHLTRLSPTPPREPSRLRHPSSGFGGLLFPPGPRGDPTRSRSVQSILGVEGPQLRVPPRPLTASSLCHHPWVCGGHRVSNNLA